MSRAWCVCGTVGNFGFKQRSSPQLNSPHGVALADGKLFVADCFNHRVCAFDTSLKFLFSFGTEGKAPGELRYPRGIANLGAGELVVASQGNHRLEVFNVQGEYVRSIGSGRGNAPGEFKEPVELTVAHGRLYVCEGEGRRFQVLTPDGASLHVLPLPTGAQLFGLCADAHRVYAADTAENKVHVLAVRG